MQPGLRPHEDHQKSVGEQRGEVTGCRAAENITPWLIRRQFSIEWGPKTEASN